MWREVCEARIVEADCRARRNDGVRLPCTVTVEFKVNVKIVDFGVFDRKFDSPVVGLGSVNCPLADFRSSAICRQPEDQLVQKTLGQSHWSEAGQGFGGQRR